MEELKNKIMEKIGLDADKATDTIKLVAGFIKERIPENLHGFVDGLMGEDDDDDDGDGGSPLDAVKGMFGG